MKQLITTLCLALAVSAQAQVKNVNELITMAKNSYPALEGKLNGNGYWKQDEKGKMDTIYYTRWVPKNTTENNLGEMVMCYYKKRNLAVDYLVSQTLKKADHDKRIAEVKKLGYKLMDTKNTDLQKLQVYSKGNINISIMEARQNANEGWMYIVGIKVL